MRFSLQEGLRSDLGIAWFDFRYFPTFEDAIAFKPYAERRGWVNTLWRIVPISN